MIKSLLFITLLTAIFLTASCNDAKTNSKPANAKGNANANVKTGVAPVADSEIAVIEMEEPAFGTIKLELYSNIAPLQVERFKTLAKEGYYNGIAFHRINATVIQAGNADTKPGKQPNPMKEGDSGKPNVPAEFSDVPYTTGILGAARLGNDVNSANSQFFIMLKPEPQFDKNYTVFGKVIEGMTNVNTIAGVPKNGEKPIDAVRIKSITIQPK
ncbi:MAG TPA: peptidylprolyl isomerase [Pyrinomonadaceae bacterium]|nr:peptidylprolyl isomerase [Pyrinomonadaceae bacterium]